ncbi:SigE family RNA polymerase sigma factor [Streptomyces sp. SID5594]|jgi:RNA polymerase sigma-70 factor (sigma-E family)|uniref:SigE family RNA polymerase sigma factor n=1 Tax=unclassified Streptomyces TaxID=2593676 RepID=UPI00037112CD|nr:MULTISPECIES: SigE family RNA polymerase sigma factor [unclassified Streptomyces]MZF57499.1 SigE family RNA polymerase sigma factor [Streptomyces sp. SID5594]
MAQGEVLAFEDYVRTRQEALLRSARRLVPDPVDAQDLLQTALVRTYGRWDGIADKSLADAYLRRVMINTRTEWWRARKLEEVPTEQLPDASVDDGSEQRADRALLMDILGILAPKQRSVVVLRHWEQMSTEETAAALGMSAGTVKSTLHRALARLRQELESRELTSREAVVRGTGGRQSAGSARETGNHRQTEGVRETGSQRSAEGVRETGGRQSAGSVRGAVPAATGRVPAQRTRAAAPAKVTSVTAARGHTAARHDGRHDERGRERCAA